MIEVLDFLVLYKPMIDAASRGVFILMTYWFLWDIRKYAVNISQRMDFLAYNEAQKSINIEDVLNDKG